VRILKNSDGFTLIELVIVIVILGILSGIAIRQVGTQVDTARYEQTKKELDQIAKALVGNPDVLAGGARTDFGYVGDVGSIPISLTALTTNPGGYATWDGPYIEAGPNGNDYLLDAWSSAYQLTDSVIRSTGSGTNIDKRFAANATSLLHNTVEGFVVDAGYQPPGTTYMDSVLVELIYPNGSGSSTTASTTLNAAGNFLFSNIPIGNHELRLIHLPTADTTRYELSVEPGSHLKLSLTHPADIW
jgi:general secretion pathway protein G